MVGAVTQNAGLVIHCVDGDIMARRGDSWATDACLPGHWRAVREWSMEKRQNHRVRPSVTSEVPLCCSLSFGPHRQSFNILHFYSCFLGTVFLTAQSCCVLFYPSAVNTKSFRQSMYSCLSSRSIYPLLISKLCHILCVIALLTLCVFYKNKNELLSFFVARGINIVSSLEVTLTAFSEIHLLYEPPYVVLIPYLFVLHDEYKKDFNSTQ